MCTRQGNTHSTKDAKNAESYQLPTDAAVGDSTEVGVRKQFVVLKPHTTVSCPHRHKHKAQQQGRRRQSHLERVDQLKRNNTKYRADERSPQVAVSVHMRQRKAWPHRHTHSPPQMRT